MSRMPSPTEIAVELARENERLKMYIESLLSEKHLLEKKVESLEEQVKELLENR